MGAVSSILNFKERRVALPTLVLVDLHENTPSPSGPGHQDFLNALEKCRLVLGCARQHNLPVAFVRYTSPTPNFLATQAYPTWIKDIMPRRIDMVFERSLPSCFASSEFGQMARRSEQLVLAGIFGETSCLATLMDGYSRNHVFTYLADASVSRGHGNVAAEDMHRAVAGIASIYGEVVSVAEWMERMSQRTDAAAG